MDGLIPTGNILCNAVETIHYGQHCDDWLLISLPILPQVPGKPVLLHPPPPPPPPPQGSQPRSSHVVGRRVWSTDGKVGAEQSAVCTEYRAEGACSEAACQQGTELGAICRSSSPFCHQVCHLILLSGDTNDEHVLNSFVYLATAFLRGGLN